jgi:hypothetical protein
VSGVDRAAENKGVVVVQGLDLVRRDHIRVETIGR